MSSKALNVCNQSIGLWFCVCDSRGRLLKCFNSNQSPSSYEDGYGGAAGEPLREDRSDFGGDGGLGDDGEILFGMEGSGLGGRRRKGLDEQTEIILAATFLVLIILAFISFVIYRCEKNYMRRRLHQSFQMSPSSLSTGGLGVHNNSNAHHVSNNNSNNPNGSAIPSISVSVQTDSALIAAAAATTSSHLHHTSLVGNGHVINMAALLTGPESVGTAATSAYHHHHHTLPHSHFRGGGSGVGLVSSGDTDDNWTNSRGIPSAQSYRDVREVIALPHMTSHSRENTLSRDHHLVSRNRYAVIMYHREPNTIPKCNNGSNHERRLRRAHHF
nr:uncharacterized protein LOC121120764 isoform X2 [Lepeophtheirus salmonis]